MSAEARGGRNLKKHVLGLLEQDDFDQALEELCSLPGRQVVNPLFSFLLHKEEAIRWKAITAMGAVVNNLAETDMEGARTVMRRLMWSLNEESGGIGWGAPEAMAEIMARNEGLADEYAAMFTSYMEESRNFLEYEVLQQGVMWGVVRMARARPDAVRGAAPLLGKYLKSPNPTVRGLAAQAAGLLGVTEVRAQLEAMLADSSEFRSFIDNRFISDTVTGVARQALARLDQAERPAN
ncbi:MAG: HEAT repeat domain-containing protein [Desulfomonile tiedjei]|nr:HEAT repeat domain-containing protein [Desulfomonile tiedjei]